MKGGANVRRGGITAAVAFCAVLGIAPVCAGEADDGMESLSLKIENATPFDVRCVAVLAHFVTRDLPPVGSQHDIELKLGRNADDGTLSFGSFGNHPMMLENLLCGIASDWTATARDLPLSALRSESDRQFLFRCSLRKGRVICERR